MHYAWLYFDPISKLNKTHFLLLQFNVARVEATIISKSCFCVKLSSVYSIRKKSPYVTISFVNIDISNIHSHVHNALRKQHLQAMYSNRTMFMYGIMFLCFTSYYPYFLLHRVCCPYEIPRCQYPLMENNL